jgi:hypothetical protein
VTSARPQTISPTDRPHHNPTTPRPAGKHRT